MVTRSPYKLYHVTRPGYGEPKPMTKETCEPQADIDRCLDCTVPLDKCHGLCGHGTRPKEKGGYRNYSQARYYERHKEEISAKKRAAYQAKKAKEE